MKKSLVGKLIVTSWNKSFVGLVVKERKKDIMIKWLDSGKILHYSEESFKASFNKSERYHWILVDSGK